MSRTILSVNSNKAMNYLLQTVFEKEYRFIAASHVFSAVNHLRQHTVQTLLVDVDAQADESWELIQHVKSSRLLNISVIVLATHNTEAIRQKCFEYGVDEIFFKPFNPVDLIAAVSSLTEETALSPA